VKSCFCRDLVMMQQREGTMTTRVVPDVEGVAIVMMMRKRRRLLSREDGEKGSASACGVVA
jgi:hypothetical protein